VIVRSLICFVAHFIAHFVENVASRLSVGQRLRQSVGQKSWDMSTQPRILHLIGQLTRGGAEGQLLLVCKELADRGWQQTILTFNPGQVWDNRVPQIGCKLLRLPRRKNRLVRILELYKAIKAEQPHIVHSWSHHTNVYAGLLKTIARFRLILSLRNNPLVNSFSGRQTRRFPAKYAYERADCVVGNSYLSLAAARMAGLRIAPLMLVGNILIPRRDSGSSEEQAARPSMVTVGDLIPRKGHRTLFQALALLVASGYDFRLLIAGDGPERNSLEAFSKELGLTGKVEFLGEVEDIHPLLERCQLLVHPASMEGLSNAILEGMAARLPVCVTAVGAIPEFVEDGLTGFLVPPDDATLLAEKLALLLDDPFLRARLGAAGRGKIEALCNPARVVQGYERAYNFLLDRQGTPASGSGNGARISRVSRPIFLMYHNLLPEAAPTIPVACHQLTWRDFRNQMRALRGKLLDPLEVNHLLEERKKLPSGFVVTFDDGGEGLLLAGELLAEMKAVGVAFICPGTFVKGLWFYRLADALVRSRLTSAAWRGHALDLSSSAARLRTYSLVSDILFTEIPAIRDRSLQQVESLLNVTYGSALPALRTLNEAGIRKASKTDALCFANHSSTHSSLPVLPERELRNEIADAQEWLNRSELPTIPWFALPRGAYDDRVLGLLAERGLVPFGASSRSQDDQILPRIGIYPPDANPLRFRLKLMLKGRS
jgi:glycosyltransferase involved in cell wall biosynthesis